MKIVNRKKECSKVDGIVYMDISATIGDCDYDKICTEVPLELDWGLLYLLDEINMLNDSLGYVNIPSVKFNKINLMLKIIDQMIESVDLEVADINLNLVYYDERTDENYELEVDDIYVYNEYGEKANFIFNEKEIDKLMISMEDVICSIDKTMLDKEFEC